MPPPLPRLSKGPEPPTPVDKGAGPKASEAKYKRPAAQDVPPPYPGTDHIVVLPKADEDTVVVLKCPQDKASCPYLDSSTNDILGFLWECGASDNPSPTQRTSCYRFVDQSTLGLREALHQMGFLDDQWQLIWVAECFVLHRSSPKEPADYVSVLAAGVGGNERDRQRLCRLGLALQIVREGMWSPEVNVSLRAPAVMPRLVYDMVRLNLQRWHRAEATHDNQADFLDFPAEAAAERSQATAKEALHRAEENEAQQKAQAQAKPGS